MQVFEPGLAVTGGVRAGAWTYQWPHESAPQTFFASRLYEARGPNLTAWVRVARCRQPTWGRERERALVFKHQNGPDSRTYYPWTEFVETDDGRFAAAVPSPRRPRAQLKDGARLPNHIDPAHIARTDTVFRSIHSGASLRYVVDRDDEVSMVQHAYWVATLRHRI